MTFSTNVKNVWNFVGLQARGYLILTDRLLLFDNWKNYNDVLKKKSNDTSLLITTCHIASCGTKLVSPTVLLEEPQKSVRKN